MYSQPTDSDTDQLAYILSEILNDNAPIGWERYRFAANCLMANGKAQEILARAASS